MKTVYKTEDGTIFENEVEAKTHEAATERNAQIAVLSVRLAELFSSSIGTMLPSESKQLVVTSARDRLVEWRTEAMALARAIYAIHGMRPPPFI